MYLLIIYAGQLCWSDSKPFCEVPLNLSAIYKSSWDYSLAQFPELLYHLDFWNQIALVPYKLDY